MPPNSKKWAESIFLHFLHFLGGLRIVAHCGALPGIVGFMNVFNDLQHGLAMRYGYFTYRRPKYEI